MAIGTTAFNQKKIALGLDEDTFEQVEAMRSSDDRSFSSMVRILIREAIAARRKADG